MPGRRGQVLFDVTSERSSKVIYPYFRVSTYSSILLLRHKPLLTRVLSAGDTSALTLSMLLKYHTYLR